MNRNKIYAYMLEKNIYSLRAKELIELGFSYYEITKLVQEKVIKKTQRGVYDLDDFNSIVSYTKNLYRKNQEKAVFYQEQLLKIVPNNEALNLVLFKYYLFKQDMKQAFRIYDNLYKEKMIGKEDTSLLLVLFSRMMPLTEEDALAVSYINREDIVLENLSHDEKITMNNHFRLALFRNNLDEASSIAKNNEISNPFLYSMFIPLVQMQNYQEEKVFALIKQKKYKEAYSYFQNDYTLANKGRFLFCSVSLLLSKLLGEDFTFDEKLINFKYKDIAQMLKDEDLNALLSYWQEKEEQAKSEKAKWRVKIVLDLLDEVLKNEKAEEKVLVKEEKIKQENNKEKVVVSKSSTTSQSIVNFSTVVSSLIDEDFTNVKSIVKQYLKGLNKEEYLEIATNEIKLNLLDKDTLYSTSMFLLTSLENGMYTFNSNECLQKYYQALEEKNIVKAKIYLSSISSANAVGLSNFNVDRFIEMTNALTENQVEASVLDKINQLDGKKKILTKEKEVKINETFQDKDTKEEKNKVQEESVVQSQAAGEEIVVQDIKEESTESKIKTGSNKEEVIEEQEETEDKTVKMSPDEIKTILYNLFLEKGILEEADLENLDNKKQFLNSNLLKFKNGKYHPKDLEDFYKYGEKIKDACDFERAGKCFTICYQERPKFNKYFYSYFRYTLETGTVEEILPLVQTGVENKLLSKKNRNTLLYLLSLTFKLPDALQQEVENFYLKNLISKTEDKVRQDAKATIFMTHDFLAASKAYSKNNSKIRRTETDKLIFSTLNRVMKEYQNEMAPIVELIVDGKKLTKNSLNDLGFSDEKIETLTKQNYLKKIRRYEYDFIDIDCMLGYVRKKPLEQQEKYLEFCYSRNQDDMCFLSYLNVLIFNKEYNKALALIKENENIAGGVYYAEWVALLSKIEPAIVEGKEQDIKETLNEDRPRKEILKKILEGKLGEACQLNNANVSSFSKITRRLLEACLLNEKSDTLVANIIDEIKKKDAVEFEFSISTYLKQLNKSEYKDLILNLIQVRYEDPSSIEQEIKNIAKEDYTFSFEKYLPDFYESLEKEDYNSIHIYYEIIKNYSEYKEDAVFLQELSNSLSKLGGFRKLDLQNKIKYINIKEEKTIFPESTNNKKETKTSTVFKEKYYGLENIDSIADTIVEMNMDVLGACKKLGLDNEKTNLVLLFCARDAFAEDNMQLGNKFLNRVEKSKDKTDKVKALYKTVLGRKKVYSKNLSEEEKRLILRPKITAYTAK